MVGALERLAELAALFLAQSRAAVAADVVERPRFSLPIAQEDQTFTHEVLDKILTRPSDLALMPETEPLAEKDPLPLVGENILRNKIVLGQSPGAGAKTLRRFASCGHGFELRMFLVAFLSEPIKVKRAGPKPNMLNELF